jgi:hypothetical protein
VLGTALKLSAAHASLDSSGRTAIYGLTKGTPRRERWDDSVYAPATEVRSSATRDDHRQFGVAEYAKGARQPGLQVRDADAESLCEESPVAGDPDGRVVAVDRSTQPSPVSGYGQRGMSLVEPCLANKVIITNNRLGSDGEVHRFTHSRDRFRARLCASWQIPRSETWWALPARISSVACSFSQGPAICRR